MAAVLEECARFAPSDHPMVLVGERGVGKSALAGHVHVLSHRQGEFVDGSLAGLAPGLELSYLVGHVRGAFTGALADRPGVIEAAHRGTLFLDELGLASTAAQGVLLHVLEHKTVRRVGETRRRAVDTRIVAATNADLDAMCQAGTFRQDLLDRFGYDWISVPPLRERRDEILSLTALYLTAECASAGRGEPPALSDSVRECLQAAPWLDNVRGVVSLCRHLARQCGGDDIVELRHLPDRFVRTLGSVAGALVKKSRQQAIREAVTRAGGNKTKAAKDLKMSRRHLHRLLKAAEPT